MLNVCATESQNRRFVEGISRTSTVYFRIMFQESFPHIKSEVMTWALCQWNAVIHTPLLEPHTHQRWCSQPDGKTIQIWIDQHSCICVIIWNYTEKWIWVLILICNSRKKITTLIKLIVLVFLLVCGVFKLNRIWIKWNLWAFAVKFTWLLNSLGCKWS